MFPFTKTFLTPAEHSPGKNTCRYIIEHHTATFENTDNGVINGLEERKDHASCHFLVGSSGEIYKFGDPKDILWHAGISQWGKDKDLNKCSVGIEIIGPWRKGGFSKAQRVSVRKLTEHLMAALSIPAENVLRHRDITSPRSKNMELAQPGDRCRKIDPDDKLWSEFSPSFDSWRHGLTPALSDGMPFEEKAQLKGIWGGTNPTRIPTRTEASTMLSRAIVNCRTDIWDQSRPNEPVTAAELEIMTERATGNAYYGELTRSAFASYCFLLTA